MWFEVLLCLSMCKPFIMGWWHDTSRCGHVSVLVECWLHNGHKMVGKALGKHMCVVVSEGCLFWIGCSLCLWLRG